MCAKQDCTNMCAVVDDLVDVLCGGHDPHPQTVQMAMGLLKYIDKECDNFSIERFRDIAADKNVRWASLERHFAQW